MRIAVLRTTKAISFALGLSAALAATAARAESKNPADYVLRVHVLGRNQVTFFQNREADEAKGDGRANLFEGGEAHGVDFNYDCDHKLRTSFGYETYPAKWKKPGKELVVLMPIFGQSGQYFTCNFHVDVKNYVYGQQNGSVRQESVEDYKAWMVKHEYDPEHGKDIPKQLPRTAPPAGTPPERE